MLNELKDGVHSPFNIQHLTFNIQHSGFSSASRRLPQPILRTIKVPPPVKVLHHVPLELIRAAVALHVGDVSSDVDDLQPQPYGLERARKFARHLHVMQSAAV